MKESESQKKATRKYISSQYRPSIYIDKTYKEQIETWLHEHEYKSINAYLLDCLKRDGVIK